MGPLKEIEGVIMDDILLQNYWRIKRAWSNPNTAIADNVTYGLAVNILRGIISGTTSNTLKNAASNLLQEIANNCTDTRRTSTQK